MDRRLSIWTIRRLPTMLAAVCRRSALHSLRFSPHISLRSLSRLSNPTLLRPSSPLSLLSPLSTLRNRFSSTTAIPPVENSTFHPNTNQTPILPSPAVGRWLLLSSTLVFGVIVVGGVTRLTESGLSITEWRPITGVIPPLTHNEWLEEFDKYKATPEFKLYVPFRHHNAYTDLIPVLTTPSLSLTSNPSFSGNGPTASSAA